MFAVGLPGSPTSLGERATSEGGPDFLVRKADRAEWRIRRAKVLKTERAARAFALLAALVLLWSAPASAGPQSAADFKVPVEYYKCRMDCVWCSRRTAHRRRFRWACTTGWAFAPYARTGDSSK